MNSGGYTLHDVDIFAADASELQLKSDPGASGMACILRDGSHVIDFLMLKAHEVPSTGLTYEQLLTPKGRIASTNARLRLQLTPDTPVNAPEISVVICTKDRPDWLRRLLNSLAEQKTKKTFEIVVVDNNSDSPDVRTVAEEAGAVYVRETKTGLNFARNTALATATGDVVAFLDDDTTAEPEWFDNLSRTWAENPDAGCITGLVLPMSLESEAQVAFEKDGGFRRALTPYRNSKIHWNDPLHPCGAGKFGAGANMSLNRKHVLEDGGFDEALDTGRPLPGGGDLDIFYRVIRAGKMLIYDPSVVVRHDHRHEMKVLQHQYFTWGLGFFAFLQKSKQSDPDNHHNLNQTGRWFWLEMIKRMSRSLFGLEDRSTRMLAAEFCGGIKGRFGEYQRSQNRTQKIRDAAK